MFLLFNILLATILFRFRRVRVRAQVVEGDLVDPRARGSGEVLQLTPDEGGDVHVCVAPSVGPVDAKVLAADELELVNLGVGTD